MRTETDAVIQTCAYDGMASMRPFSNENGNDF